MRRSTLSAWQTPTTFQTTRHLSSENRTGGEPLSRFLQCSNEEESRGDCASKLLLYSVEDIIVQCCS